jgi:hypothetical protein
MSEGGKVGVCVCVCVCVVLCVCFKETNRTEQNERPMSKGGKVCLCVCYKETNTEQSRTNVNVRRRSSVWSSVCVCTRVCDVVD